MKKHTFLLVIIIFLYSCTYDNVKYNNTSNSENDTIGYYEARNLKGLSNFIIGESTYKNTIKQLKNEYKKDSRYYFVFEPKLIKYDTTETLLKDDLLQENVFGCPNIKSIEVDKYYIGEIEINSLKLYFFKDTLFKIRCMENEEIDNGFNSKYGKSKLTDNSIWKTPSGETTNIRPKDEDIKNSELIKIDTKKVWKNYNVKAVSQVYCKYNYEDGKYLGADNSSSDSFFEIISNDTILIKDIEKCNKNAEETKEKLINNGKKKSIDNL